MSFYQDNFVAIEHLASHNAVKIQWLEGSADMTEADFKQVIAKEKEALETFKPRAILADTLEMQYSITPALQEWHNDFLFPSFAVVGIEKLAIVVSKDIFSQVSVEQLIEDHNAAQFLSKYFDSETKAIEWIQG
ncbi:STAS/SEC14 domain-containing protein [Eisenibacter elegans]|uniref:STAS/SEC14 domain-containing protein n=1 Tax=Eisenibacter elegans TaxID=997 RepID=UPI0004177A7E|nr:STAS/SEC14 domain-containing protein [Eisenibacter elegans]